MLGKTAGGLFWMFRYLERAESLVRLVEAGLRIAMTRSVAAHSEWESILSAVGARSSYLAHHDRISRANVVDFLLRDPENGSSALSSFAAARTNARMVRTALTREVWEATNECWMTASEVLREAPSDRDMPEILATLRRQTALVRGVMTGTMLRNDIYDFSRVGMYVERADATARILDVKYYVLLPSVAHVGSSIDNAQWDTILRSVAAERAYKWLHQGDVSAVGIANFLLLDPQMPRSLLFCVEKLAENLDRLAEEYGVLYPSVLNARDLRDSLGRTTISEVIERGLHEFIQSFLSDIAALGAQVETDFRFNK